jgi:Tfp pilus assembly protein PilO
MDGRWKRLKSKLTTQHKWILVLLTFVLVNAAVWMYGLAPALDKVEAARAELDQAQQRKDKLKQELDNLNAIDADAFNQEWEAINLQVPDKGLLREFIHGLVDMTDEMGLPLPSVSISSPATEEPYFSVTLSASITGSYEQLKAFLIALEQHERLILIRSYSFSGAEDVLSCAVSFTIFAEEFEHLTPYEAPGRDNPFEVQ